MTLQKLATILLSAFFLLSSAEAGWCNLPSPTEWFTGHCGADIGLASLGYDAITIKYWWFNWYPRSKTSRADFSGECYAHDRCFEDAKTYSGQTCRDKIDQCNEKFRNNLYVECDKLPESCQRNYCKDITANKMSGLVNLFADTYKDGCPN